MSAFAWVKSRQASDFARARAEQRLQQWRWLGVLGGYAGRNGARMPATVAAALVAARENSGLSQRKLAKALGVSQATMSLREAGKSDLPAAALEDVAKKTGCCISATPNGWLVHRMDDPFNNNPERGDVHQEELDGDGVPMLGRAGAGPAVISPSDAEEWFDLRRRWLDRVDAVLEIKGDSMEPILREGDLVGIRLLPEGEVPDVGQVSAIWWPEDGEVQVKIWAGWFRDEVMLLSSNSAYPPIIVPPEKAIPKGTVFGILRMDSLQIFLREFIGWPR